MAGGGRVEVASGGDQRGLVAVVAQAGDLAGLEVAAGVFGAFSNELGLEQVSIAYDAAGPDVLRDIDLRITPGEFVGICGPTGGGKSTLVDLLIGLLQPTAGAIRVDGSTLGSRPVRWWRQLGVVPQQVFSIDDTLRANVAFGRSAPEIDEGRVRRSVEDAQLVPTVEELPQGNTQVGKR